MLNKKSGPHQNLGMKFFSLALGVAVVLFSIQMTQFGILRIHADLYELSSSKTAEEEQRNFARHCEAWTSQFGYRLICRKAIADDFFRYEIQNLDDPKANRVLEDVIKISALEPAYYLLRSRIGLYNFEPSPSLIALLRLSFVSGRAEQSVMFDRFQIALALWELLDETDKSVALGDFLKNHSGKREELYQLVVTSSPRIMHDILPMVRLRDPLVYDRLIQDVAAQN